MKCTLIQLSWLALLGAVYAFPHTGPKEGIEFASAEVLSAVDTGPSPDLDLLSGADPRCCHGRCCGKGSSCYWFFCLRTPGTYSFANLIAMILAIGHFLTDNKVSRKLGGVHVEWGNGLQQVICEEFVWRIS